MSEKAISVFSAKQIATAKVRRDHVELELIESPNIEGILAYALNGRDPADIYFFHVISNRFAFGASRIIGISKSDGKVVFDDYVGE
ncbi:hypothetical protein [Desulfosediminicola ganghwensis]|uniref:hypothetical protein n=1 Tax=Desulfosediminicola ganghwensis TaxID=2569540 RepID=UPI0010AD1624|nr:hypothetical protein [Desulfosediminicola ganghwensis]